ncbi:MAG: aldo/keto reductase [Armatimonadota bacterium]
MEYRSLGRTGCKVSPLCLGTMLFGDDTSSQDAYDIVDRAIDAGINFIDTANVYNDGTSEQIVGQALKRNGQRENVVLATKVHGTMDANDPNGQGNHRQHIMRQCEASLQRLEVDHIDLYQIHRPDSSLPIDETLGALDDLIRQGKVRYVGTSTFAAWQLMESIWCARELGLNRFVCEQPPYHLLDRRVERELLPFARTYGFGIIPWSPLAGGFLTGKYKRDGDVPEGTRFAQRSGERKERHFRDRVFDVVEGIEEIADEKGCSASQFSLAWVMNQPGVTSPIMGPRTMEQLEDNLGAIDVEVTEEDCDRIDELIDPGEGLVPYYEADFGPSRWGWL